MEKTGSEIDENALESVDGGLSGAARPADACSFEPAVPLRTEMRGGVLWAECGKRCHFFVPFVTGITVCPCHGTSRCIDRMHRLDNVGHQTYFAHPHNRFNHDEPGKAVRT